jgi:hypothetical protein
MKRFLCLALPIAALAGCGPSKADVAQSQVNQLAESWDGGEKFTPDGTDPWGGAFTAKVETGDVYRTLTVRSSGPDKLPFTQDDITATRSVKHTPISKAVAPALERIGEALGKGLGRGGVSGVREGITGKKADEKKDEGKNDKDQNDGGKKE